MIRIFFYCNLCLFFFTKSYAQDSLTRDYRAVEVDFSYVGENFNNFSGGLKVGSVYLGMASLDFAFNTSNLKWWNGGQFYIHTAWTHGGGPSAQLTGDYQVASNIEAGNHLYLQEFWYKHEIGAMEIKVGLQDLNVDFVSSDYASSFLNSSFGVIPTISGNIPAPVFPLTSLGVSLKHQMSKKIAWQLSVFDGCPTDFENGNPFNIKWAAHKGDGVLTVAEIQHSIGIKGLPGTLKWGGFSLNNYVVVVNDSLKPKSKPSDNYGMFLIFDQMLWRLHDDRKKLGMFVQLGITPKDFNFNKKCIGAGFNFNGLFNRNGDDMLGIAVAHAGIDTNTGNETALELSYVLPVRDYFYIQPDFQYIINPSGTGTKLRNCFAGILRFVIDI